MIICLLFLQISEGRKAVKNEELAAGYEKREPEDEDAAMTALPIVIGLVSLFVLYLIIKVVPALQRDNSDQWNKKEISLRMLGFESESDKERYAKLTESEKADIDDFIDEGKSYRQIVENLWSGANKIILHDRQMLDENSNIYRRNTTQMGNLSRVKSSK